MFRFRIRTLLICITVIAVLLAAAMAGWNKGVRHEHLQKSLLQHKAYVVMSHEKNVFSHTGTILPNIERRSTLPSLFETTGLSKIFRRIDSISLSTDRLGRQEIDSQFANVRDVGSFNHLTIWGDNIWDEKLIVLVNDVSINWLTITTDMLRASKGQWTAKEVKKFELMGADFGHNDLTLLPTSVEELSFSNSPDATVDAKSFSKFSRLRIIHFDGDPSAIENIESIKRGLSISVLH